MRSRFAADSSLPAAIPVLALALSATFILSLAGNASAQSAPRSVPPASTRAAALARLNPKPNSSTPVVATPVISLAQGSYSGPQTVTVTDATPGAALYFTTNGVTPGSGSSTTTGQITISRSGTLVVSAMLNGYQSSTAWATYFITSVPDSFIYTVAGSGTLGFSGDGGLATQAQVNYPAGTAEDSSGNIYIADTYNNVVRKVNASTGDITTIAGTGIEGHSGDNGAATSAELARPNSLAFDSSGNLYISEAYNSIGNGDVREIAKATGTISTYAGSTSATALGDGGPAASAQLVDPLDIAVDSSNNLYILAADLVREVNAQTQNIATVAGGGSTLFVTSGPATDLFLRNGFGIALDSAANIYIADPGSSVVWVVTRSTGNFSVFAGTYNAPGYLGDGGPATSARLNSPSALAVDAANNVYISDEFNEVLREVAANTGIITTVAGNGNGCFSYADDGTTALSADICFAQALSFDTSGNLYFLPSYSDRVKELTAVGTPPSTPTADPVFGVPAGSYSGPQTLTVTDATPGASVYISVIANPPSTFTVNQDSVIPGQSISYHGPIDITGTATIVALAVAPGHTPSAVVSSAYTITTPSPTIVSTIAGNGTYGFSGAGGPATSAELGFPAGIAMDSAGNLYIADANDSVIWKVAAGSGTISIVAGTGQPGYSGDNGPATSATLTYPDAVAVDASGNLFIADTANNRVREVLASNGNIVTYAGNGISSGTGGSGGPATDAYLIYPTAVALDGKGDLYIAAGSMVYEVDPSTGIINLVAGGGTELGDGGPATSAMLDGAEGIALDSAGDLYIADTFNGRVRVVNAQTGIITTVVGNGDPGTSGDGLLATQAEAYPVNLAVDGSGDIFIANNGSGELREFNATTGILSNIAGNGFGAYNGDGGPASMASMCPSWGILLDQQANIYFSDLCGEAVRKITYNAPAPAPTFDPPAGTYTTAQSVVISDSAPNSTIYYTTNGSTPTTSSKQYGGEIDVAASETIQAIAVASGYGQSGVGSAAYTIQAIPTITWAAPADIVYGMPLSSTQLDATASVAGTFAYSPASGTVLAAGPQKLSVTFTPTDTADYATATSSVTLTVNPATPTLTLASSANPADDAQAITFTAKISSSAGTPAGSVTFLSGTSQLGSATLSTGSATYTTSALATGSYSISAQYTGDTNFSSATSNVVTQVVNLFAIGPTSGASSSSTISPGGTATYSLSVTPPGNSAVSFSVAGLPTGATFAFNPSTVPAAASTTTVILSVTVPSQSAATVPDQPGRPSRMPLAFALLLLPLLGLRRLRKVHRFLLVLLLSIAGASGMAVLSGCGGGGGNSSGGGDGQQQPKTYNLTVTATAGSATQATALTLTVQ